MSYRATIKGAGAAPYGLGELIDEVEADSPKVLIARITEARKGIDGKTAVDIVGTDYGDTNSRYSYADFVELHDPQR